MNSTFEDRVQTIQNGPLFRSLNEQIWLDMERGRLFAHVEGVNVTLFDARSIPDKNGWRAPILPDLKRARLVLLLGWGAGKGAQALPRFDQSEAMRLLDSIRYDPEANAVVISITSGQLTNWLAFIGRAVGADCEVWSLSAGRPARISWLGGA